LRTRWKIIITFTVLVGLSIVLMSALSLKSDRVGLEVGRVWCVERGFNQSGEYCVEQLNSPRLIIDQGISLGLFLFVIALTVLKMEWRLGAAMIAVAMLVLIEATPPQYIISSVSWNLVLFLIGSMTMAGVLREMGVFRFLAVRIVKASRGNAVTLVALLALLAYSLAAVLDEVTSIVYVTMLVLELSRIIQINPVPLLIFSVLATNTGSSALPIGNPIGVYLLFATRMDISVFIKTSLPLSLIDLVLLVLIFVFVEKKFINSISKSLVEKSIRLTRMLRGSG
jgi:Na+/H+ antiporter NhaD/arsenite permease-like protein